MHLMKEGGSWDQLLAASAGGQRAPVTATGPHTLSCEATATSEAKHNEEDYMKCRQVCVFIKQARVSPKDANTSITEVSWVSKEKGMAAECDLMPRGGRGLLRDLGQERSSGSNAEKTKSMHVNEIVFFPNKGSYIKHF